MTELKIIDKGGSAGTDTQDHSPADLAREYLLGTSRFHVIMKLITGMAAVVLSAALDIGLMYNANSARFLDAFGNSTGSTLALWAASAMSLGVFWIIGAAYDLGGRWRWLAGLIYALLVAFLTVLLLPEWRATCSSMCSAAPALSIMGLTCPWPLYTWAPRSYRYFSRPVACFGSRPRSTWLRAGTSGGTTRRQSNASASSRNT